METEASVTQVVWKLRCIDIETALKKLRGKLIDISSIFKVQSTSSYPCRIDGILSMWVSLS